MILFFSLYQLINYEIDIKTLHGKFMQARKIVTIGEFDSLMRVVDYVMGGIYKAISYKNTCILKNINILFNLTPL